ncbi:MAG: type II secretion system protein GspM [Pseudomonadota bacterium]
MIVWFNSLSQREKFLIVGAAALIGVVLFVTMIMGPVLRYQSNARIDYDDASATYQLVARAAATPATDKALDSSTLRSVLTRTAGRSGVVINRINSNGEEIDVAISNISTSRLYGWLGLLEMEHKVIVREAQIRPSNDGRTVTARLSLVEGR